MYVQLSTFTYILQTIAQHNECLCAFRLQGEHHDGVGLRAAIRLALSGISAPADLMEIEVRVTYNRQPFFFSLKLTSVIITLASLLSLKLGELPRSRGQFQFRKTCTTPGALSVLEATPLTAEAARTAALPATECPNRPNLVSGAVITREAAFALTSS